MAAHGLGAKAAHALTTIQSLRRPVVHLDAGDMPTAEQFAKERRRQDHTDRVRRATYEVLGAIAVAAAVAVLVSTLAFPLFRIYGDSMEPTLKSGDVVLAHRVGGIERGDLVAFWLNNRILVKRVMGVPGDWVDIDEDGVVSVNGEALDESYLADGALSKGTVNISLPYQVPDGRYFVMGDNREVSLDSRVSEVGCVPRDQIAGRLDLRIWPLESIGGLS